MHHNNHITSKYGNNWIKIEVVLKNVASVWLKAFKD